VTVESSFFQVSGGEIVKGMTAPGKGRGGTGYFRKIVL